MKLNILKKSLGIAAIAFTLSACGGGSSANDYSGGINGLDDNPQTQDIEAVNIIDLPAGYQLNGYVEDGEKVNEAVKLIYCPNSRYSYYRGDENFNGTYEIKTDRDEVLMKDDAGGSYALQATNGIIEVGYAYKCRDLRPKTTGVVITRILPHPCTGNQ